MLSVMKTPVLPTPALCGERGRSGAGGVFTQPLCAFDFHVHVGALTDFGVAGVLTKHATADELVTALERVARGERVVDPAFPVELGDDWWPGRAEGLTEREAQAVTLICRGLPNGAIANELNVSLNTLKSYIRSAYRTMGVASRSEAVLWGVARGLHVDGRS